MGVFQSRLVQLFLHVAAEPPRLVESVALPEPQTEPSPAPTSQPDIPPPPVSETPPYSRPKKRDDVTKRVCYRASQGLKFHFRKMCYNADVALTLGQALSLKMTACKKCSAIMWV